MQASDKTIEFCKAWIEGKQRKSQHMHYYIVKTEHAEFMMKRNDQPDLVAIRDSFGHIFIPGDVLYNCSIHEEKSLRNPFLALISKGYYFRYHILTEISLKYRNNVSKWQTIDHRIATHTISGIPINISLVRIGEEYFTTEIEFKNSITPMPLTDWANFSDVRNGILKSAAIEQKIQPYTFLSEVKGKPENLAKCRSVYVDFAGDAINQSIIGDKWVAIPTAQNRLKDITNNIYDVFKTRPSPIQYGVPFNLVDSIMAYNRLKYPFHPYDLNDLPFISPENILDISNFKGSGDSWGGWLVNNLDHEVALNLIRYINDDDEWLKENSHIIRPFILGQQFRRKMFSTGLNGYALLIEESNPSILSTHVLYVKGVTYQVEYGRLRKTGKFDYFTKFIPSPNSDIGSEIETFMAEKCT